MLSIKKKKLLSLTCCLTLLLTGCSSAPKTAVDGQNWQKTWTRVGTNIGIDTPKQLTLLDNKETLAADGLYYATWVTGGSVPYENSEGDTIELYDAQLYFLTNEATSEKKAHDACDTWLAAARKNYEICTENTITCNGQSYTMITYNCIGKDNPYAHGVSAFGTCGVNAVCAEFTCVENYTEDLEPLLTDVLNGCHYRAD